MTTVIIFHEVQGCAAWAKAWHKTKGSRHEMFGKLGDEVPNLLRS